MKRVLLGGVVAALIINLGEGIFGLLMKEEWEAALRRLGANFETPFAMLLPILWSVAIGVLSVWLYAAILPRYGPGKSTAVRAALAVWAFTTVTFSIAMSCLGLFPVRLTVFSSIWSLVEVTVAMLVASMLYKES
jgi:hypothetical protein